jgi:hypothetical protein
VILKIPTLRIEVSECLAKQPGPNTVLDVRALDDTLMESVDLARLPI